MKEKFKRFRRKGGLTFSFVGLLYVLMLVFLVVVLCSGCGKVSAEEALDTPDASKRTHEERMENASEFSVTICPGADDSADYYAAEDVGSHVMYITHPEVDETLKASMDQYHIDVVEIYFRRDEGNEKPAYKGDPDASAVYYFYENNTDELTVSFKNYGKEAPLVAGVHLDSPSYVMKYTVACGEGQNIEAISSMLIEDYTGGQVFFSHIDKATFTVDSLLIEMDALNGGGYEL